MRRPAIVAFAIVATVLLVTALPAAAAHTVTISEHSNATELGNGSLTNSEIERSGDPAVVGHDQARSSAVARWAFDYGSSSTAYDHVGSNDGTLNGDPTWVSGKRGQALDFDGSGDYVETADVLSGGPSEATVSAWVKSSTSGSGGLVTNGRSTSEEMKIEITSGQYAVTVRDSLGNFKRITGSATDGNWHLITGVFDSGTIYLYEDGSLVSTGSVAGNNLNSQSDSALVGIGRRSDGSIVDSDAVEATIDDARVYSTALTPGQVRRLADSPPAKLSATATERWAFDNGSGTVAYGDEGNDGTITGATWTTGQSGQALDFDGTAGDGVSIAEENASTFTMTIWFKPVDDGNRHSLLSDGSFSNDFEYQSDFDKVTWVNDATDLGETGIQGGVWHHFAISFNGTHMRLFHNGTLADAKANPHPGGFTEIATDTNDPTNGTIDEVRYYDRALSEGDLQYIVDNPGAQLNETSRYNATHSVTNSVEGWTDLELHNATATVEWRTAGGSTLSTATYTTSGNKTQTWSESSADTVTVNVTFEPTHPDHYARLDDDGARATTHVPQPDNASASPDTTTSTISSQPVTLSIDVTDADFPTSQGDQVTAEFFVDGSSVGSDTLNANGTASVSHSPTGGTHTWYVELTDDYGHFQNSSTFDFVAPSVLEIREEAEPHDRITQATGVTVKQFGENGTLNKLNVTDGNVSLVGLPLDEEYVFVVDADGYHQRAILIVDLTDQASVFVPSVNESAIQNTITVDDIAGFTAGDASLLVQKSINRSLYDPDADPAYQWTTISGDRLGADKQYTTELIKDDRYRVILRNEDGDERVLGEYDAQLNGTVTLTVESTGVDLDETTAGVAYGAAIDKDADQLTIEYNDTADNTGDLELIVWETNNRTNELVNTTLAGPHGNVVYNQPLTANETEKSWTISIEGPRSGSDDVDLQFTTGVDRQDPFSQIPELWVHVAVFGGSLLAPGLLGGHRAEIGALVSCVFVGLAWWLQAVPDGVGALAIVAAIVVAVAFKVGLRGGDPVQ